ncbi:transposase zinc-binding domain-containing protein, partial [Eubacterium ramulus]
MSNVLQDIFKNHYEEMLYILHPRKSVIENVDRMINCGDPSFGGAMYGCAKCGTFKFVPFRCHSRFCPTCGTKYSIDRTTSMSFKIINTQHRHCVFTIDSELRHFFLEKRKLLGLLFDAVQSVIFRAFYKD